MGKHINCLPIRIFLLGILFIKEHSRLKHLLLMTKNLCYIVGYFYLDSSLDEEGFHVYGYEDIFLVCPRSRNANFHRFILRCVVSFSHNSLLF